MTKKESLTLLKEIKKIVKKYYSEDLVNLNNTINTKSYELNEKIKKLRLEISSYFFINDWEKIIFFPNDFYSKTTILNSLNIDENWKIYLDKDQDYFKSKNFSNFEIYELNNLKEEDKKILFWISYKKKYLNFFKKLEKKKEKNIKVFLSTDKLLNKDDWKKITPYVDFFLFNPKKILNLHGISILCLNQNTKLQTKYLGSNSVEEISFDNFSIKENYQSFECGTQNFALLLSLEKIFEFLNKKSEFKGI